MHRHPHSSFVRSFTIQQFAGRKTQHPIDHPQEQKKERKAVWSFTLQATVTGRLMILLRPSRLAALHPPLLCSSQSISQELGVSVPLSRDVPSKQLPVDNGDAMIIQIHFPGSLQSIINRWPRKNFSQRTDSVSVEIKWRRMFHSIGSPVRVYLVPTFPSTVSR